MLLYITPKLSRDVIWESLKEENEKKNIIENAERVEVSLENWKQVSFTIILCAWEIRDF